MLFSEHVSCWRLDFCSQNVCIAFHVKTHSCL